MKNIALVVLLISFNSLAQNKTYYLSPSGNDGNSGLLITSAWKTISKINTINFQPGDKILFEGNQIFTGTIDLDASDIGNASNPIIISSYGNGKATINSGTARGLHGYNVQGIEVRSLVFIGNGATANTASGIDFYMDNTSSDLEHIVIDSVECSGYGERGILIGSWATTYGYNNIRIVRSAVHDCGRGGIETYGAWPLFSHTNVYIGHCKAYRNYGRTDITTTHTGSGIAVSGVDGAVIEYCEAYENGQNNRNAGGGPFGIWFSDVKNGIIQFSESHHNQAGLHKDGGGFDIDGGSQDCIIQYCYSHENEGAGFGMYEYGSPNPFINNTIRYNISQDDARRNNDAGLSIWANDNDHKLINCEAYNNTIYSSLAGVIDGIPSAIKISDVHMSGVKVRNNIFYTNGAIMINASAPVDITQLHLQNNNYYSASGGSIFLWGVDTYVSLTSWRTAASLQETFLGNPVGTTSDPLLTSPGNAGTLGLADGASSTLLTNYHLQIGSPAIDAGLNIQAISSLNTGIHDFFNNPLPINTMYDMGAHEFPGALLTFKFREARLVEENNKVLLTWKIEGSAIPERFIIQGSLNGRDFSKLDELPGSNENYSVSKNDKVEYYRIAALSKGRTIYSAILRNNSTTVTALNIFPNPASYQLNIQLSNNQHAAEINIITSLGAKIFQQQFRAGEIIQIPVAQYQKGLYYITIQSGATRTSKMFFKE